MLNILGISAVSNSSDTRKMLKWRMTGVGGTISVGDCGSTGKNSSNNSQWSSNMQRVQNMKGDDVVSEIFMDRDKDKDRSSVVVDGKGEEKGGEYDETEQL
jgi:hypothetical protein